MFDCAAIDGYLKNTNLYLSSYICHFLSYYLICYIIEIPGDTSVKLFI